MIITADDFGLSHEVNDAVLRAFEEGLITHASVMANMPGFEEACDQAQERGVATRVGVHLVLSEGEPLTSPMRSLAKMCDSKGQFRRWFEERRLLLLTSTELKVVFDELRAQVKRCREMGLNPSHLDSHHHTHVKTGSMPLVTVRLARAERIPRVRLARVPRRSDSPFARVAIAQANKVAVNWLLRANGLAGATEFGSVSDYAKVVRSRPDREPHFELVTHPVFRQDGALVDAFAPFLTLAEMLRFAQAGIDPVKDQLSQLPSARS